MTTSSRRRSLIARTPAGAARAGAPQIRVGGELLASHTVDDDDSAPVEGDSSVPDDSTSIDGESNEPLEALSVGDFGEDDDFSEDDDSEEWFDGDEDDSEEYVPAQLGLRLGANKPAADLIGLGDIEERVAAPENASPPAVSITTSAKSDDVIVEVNDSAIKGTFETGGKALDSEVMVQDDSQLPFQVTVEHRTQPRGAPSRNDQALPYLALVTSTAGMMAGAALTAVGLIAFASIISSMQTPPPAPEPVVAVEEEPEVDETQAGAATGAADSEGGDDQKEVEDVEEATDAPAPAPRRRRRRAPKPEPEPEPETEPEAPVEPEPAPAPAPVAPEPEPTPKKRGLFRKRRKD